VRRAASTALPLARSGGSIVFKRFATTAVIALGHAFVQNLRRGHHELALDASPALRLATAFTGSLRPSDRKTHPRPRSSGSQQRNGALPVTW
jgi:hypothetical protein